MNNREFVERLNRSVSSIRDINFCDEPSGTCKEEGIRAHTVQHALLKRLQNKDNKVLTAAWQNYTSLKSMVESSSISFDLVPIRSATTFRGLCKKHDEEIFNPIDDDLDVYNKEHQFLLAYRAALREYFVKVSAVKQMQSFFESEEGLDSEDFEEFCKIKSINPDIIKEIFLQKIMHLHQVSEYKYIFDKALLDKCWNILKSWVKIIHVECPTIAVSSEIVIVDSDPVPSYFRGPSDEQLLTVPRVFLQVLPINNKETAVVFSALQRDFVQVNFSLSRLFSSDGYLFNYLLSKYIIQSCDFFALSPDYWDKKSEESKKAIEEFYFQTIPFEYSQHMLVDKHQSRAVFERDWLNTENQNLFLF